MWTCVLLGALTFALYAPVLWHPFVNYDDTGYVTENAHVQAGLKWDSVRWAFTTGEQSNWHPFTWLSHELDCTVYGLKPAGHHLTSVLFHAANVVLLFLLVLYATGSIGCSLLVAALFAVHPLNVESVAWVAERKNVLSTFFFLLSLGAYGWYARKPNLKAYAVLAAWFALGLLAKPMIVTLPFVLLLLDYWPLQRIAGEDQRLGKGRERKKRKELSAKMLLPAFAVVEAPFSRLAIEKLPLLGLSAGSAIITIIVQRGGLPSTSVLPLSVRLQNMIWAYGMYLWRTVWPNHLAAFYPYQGKVLTEWQVGLAAMVLALISTLVWRARTRRYLLTGWLWFLGTLVPVIGLVQVGEQAMADRYAYIPLIGIFGIIVFGAAELADRESIALPWRTAAALVIVLSLSAVTFRQIGYWKSSYDLWSHALRVTKGNFLAETSLGAALIDLGRREEALTHFQNAAAINPRDSYSRANIAAMLQSEGRLQEAIEQYEAAIRMSSDPGLLAFIHSGLGTAYRDLGDFAKARDHYEEALRLNPTLTEAQQGLESLGVGKGR